METREAPAYEKGSMQGRWFTQWRIEELEDLLLEVRRRGVAAEDAKIWYDEGSDFHRLAFTEKGHRFEVRLYKCFGLDVDGRDVWSGAPLSAFFRLAQRIAELANS